MLLGIPACIQAMPAQPFWSPLRDEQCDDCQLVDQRVALYFGVYQTLSDVLPAYAHWIDEFSQYDAYDLILVVTGVRLTPQHLPLSTSLEHIVTWELRISFCGRCLLLGLT